jgi:hypothetical protein
MSQLKPIALHILNSDIRGGAEEQAALFIKSSQHIFNHKILLLKYKKESNLFDNLNTIRGFIKCFIFLLFCKEVKFIHTWLPLSEFFILVLRFILPKLRFITLINSYHGPFPYKLKGKSINLRAKIHPGSFEL